jgi:hypothetical protein
MMLELNITTPRPAPELPPAAAAREQINAARRLAQAKPLTFETIDELDRTLCAALRHLDDLQRQLTPRVA